MPLERLLQADLPVWELILRGTMLYWFLFLLFRFVLPRDTGAVRLADILLIALISDASQNGMVGESKTVGGAFITIGTIAGWNYAFDWLAFRFAWFQRFSAPRPVPLVTKGKVLTVNLTHAMLSDEEFASQLRSHGVDCTQDVKLAMLEPDGRISVILNSTNGNDSSDSSPGPSSRIA